MRPSAKTPHPIAVCQRGNSGLFSKTRSMAAPKISCSRQQGMTTGKNEAPTAPAPPKSSKMGTVAITQAVAMQAAGNLTTIM